MSKIIIIPIHNQVDYLKRCVESVIKHTTDPVIILVDDGSTDKATIDYIDKSGHIVLRSDKAYGFTTACNNGIQFALDNYEFKSLCLLNSDAEVVTPDWYDKVEKHIDRQIGVAGVVSDNALSQTVNNVESYLQNINNRQAMGLVFVHGFCYFISKNLIDKIGLMDQEKFPHYGSEDDYSLKSIKAGFRNVIACNVLVKHKNNVSYKEKVRADHVKTALPDLISKWGKRYVDTCIRRSWMVGKYINNGR